MWHRPEQNLGLTSMLFYRGVQAASCLGGSFPHKICTHAKSVCTDNRQLEWLHRLWHTPCICHIHGVCMYVCVCRYTPWCALDTYLTHGACPGCIRTGPAVRTDHNRIHIGRCIHIGRSNCCHLCIQHISDGGVWLHGMCCRCNAGKWA